ncbi:MAG: phosphoribosylanthranilate isomerase [Porticoccaceae bacterium]
MKRTRVKICGITRVDDARVAAEAGADAIGLVFYQKSPRFVERTTAAAIARAVGPFVTTVGLFVNAPADEVREILDAVDLQLLQFHGDEDDAYCRQFGRPFIKAIRMSPDLDLNAEVARFPGAGGFLFDAWHKDKYGGTGETFEWQRLPRNADFPLVLAGGLTPANVAEAVSKVAPYGVDVSGGVEAAPGIKSAELVQRFITHALSG